MSSIRRSPLLDFAEEHYVILPPASKTGPFKIENGYWLAEQMYALSDPSIREVTAMQAAQGGKNLLCEIFISYIIVNAPGNILFYGQTDLTAARFGEDRVLKRAKEIPIISNVWPDTKGAARENQVKLEHLTMEFLGVGKGNIEGKSAPYVMCDEKHLKTWKGLGAIVKKRCDAYWDHKIFNLSTAGDQGSEIDLDFHRGTQEDWHLGCPACHKAVRLTWSQEVQTIVWEAPPEQFKKAHPSSGEWNFTELRKLVRFRCPWCKCEERDSEPLRKEMNRLGCYVTDNPFAPPDHRSFHVSQIAYPWISWESMAEEWINACELSKTGDLTNLRNFVIRTMGQTWTKKVSNSSTAHVTGDYMVVGMLFSWEQEKERFGTVDVQERGGRHFWLVCRSWAAGGASRLIMAYRCESWDEVKRRLDENHIKSYCVGVDSRHATEEVKEVCAREGWLYMVADMTRTEYDWQGPSGSRVKRPYKRSEWTDTTVTKIDEHGRKKRVYAYGLIFSKDWARSVLANRVSGQGTEWGLPSDINNLVFRGTAKIESSYLGQLNSWVEKEVEVKATGEKKLQWTQINTDDHIRACEEMQLPLAAICGFFPSGVQHGQQKTPVPGGGTEV